MLYHDLRYGIFNINSGVSTSQIVLSSITGKVAFIFFTVKNVTALSGDGAFTYNKISNFSILDATSTNITSGQPISDALSLNYLSAYWTNSSYLCETATGSNATGNIVNNTYWCVILRPPFDSRNITRTICGSTFLTLSVTNCHRQILMVKMLLSLFLNHLYSYYKKHPKIGNSY